ncbi:MAG: formylglycine-generating enzyme family protein [Sphaerochaeta sp.]|nr:formylglycine-generating enzyme family protein [Sphaerochaeta sp.]
MYKKKLFVVALVLVLSLVALAASGENELENLRIRSQSDDPTVLMKVVASVDLYDTILLDELETKYENAIQTLQLRFSGDIAAYNAMEPNIWETDRLFEERKDKEYSRLDETILVETKKLSSDLVAAYDQQKDELDGYVDKALGNLGRSRTLPSGKMLLQNNSYARNARLWSLSASCNDAWVSYDNLSLAIDFTSIGDEMKVREEIIQFEEAIKTKVLQASLEWHIIRDFALDRFLLVADQVSITNPLSGSSYALTLENPILLKSYVVSVKTDKPMVVEDVSIFKNRGIEILSYQDSFSNSHTLNSPKKALILSWVTPDQAPKPVASPASRKGFVTDSRKGATTVQLASLYNPTPEMVFPVKISSSPVLSLVFFKQVKNGSIPLTYVEGGSFKMGSNDYSNETPVHTVVVGSFHLGTYEVTQDIYQQVMDSNPSNTKGTSLPVDGVSWFDAVAFCNALSRQDSFEEVYTIEGESVSCDWTKSGYRLPTEAEWEYAARGGSKSGGYTYAGSNTAHDVAWFGDEEDTSHEVGEKRANELGLFDMSGNVYEYCWDWYGEDYSGVSLRTNPKGPSSGSTRVLRSGSWYNDMTSVTLTRRNNSTASSRYNNVGFRVLIPAI